MDAFSVFKKNKIFALAFALVISSCGGNKSESGSNGVDDSNDSAIVQSATSVIGHVLQLEEQNFIGTLAQCSSQSFSGCSNGIRTKSFNGCDRSNSSNSTAAIYGTVILTFSSNAVCQTTPSARNSGSVTRTVSEAYAETPSGYRVLEYTSPTTIGDKTISNEDMKDFSGQIRMGGSTLTFKPSGARELIVNGVHRRGIHSTGNYGFWHTIYTGSVVNITSTSMTHSISSGTIIVALNRAKITVNNTFSNVSYPADGSCCYPTSGSLASTANGDTVTTVFSNTCGVVAMNGQSVTLPPCGAH